MLVMLAIRNGGICSPSFSAFLRFFDADALAAAKLSMNALSFGFLRVALSASETTRSTPCVIYSCMLNSFSMIVYPSKNLYSSL